MVCMRKKLYRRSDPIPTPTLPLKGRENTVMRLTVWTEGPSIGEAEVRAAVMGNVLTSTTIIKELRKLEAESRRLGERFTVVYLTDLDGRFPAAAEIRVLEVLWVVPEKARAAPPFGQVAEMRGEMRAPSRSAR